MFYVQCCSLVDYDFFCVECLQKLGLNCYGDWMEIKCYVCYLLFRINKMKMIEKKILSDGINLK